MQGLWFIRTRTNFEIALDVNDDDGVAVGIDCDDDDDDGDGDGDRDGVLGVAEISGSDDNGWVPVDTDNAGTVADDGEYDDATRKSDKFKIRHQEKPN